MLTFRGHVALLTGISLFTTCGSLMAQTPSEPDATKTAAASDSGEGAPAATPGLTPTRPTEGVFVETSQGFMVPYTQTIPGTDVTFRMVPIPGGTFKLGSTAAEDGRRPDEGPQVTVRVRPFWMAEHEVSWAEYHVFMNTYEIFKARESDQLKLVSDANRVDAVTSPTPLYEPSTTYQLGEDPEHPAVTMSQFAARQYTKWLSLLSGDFYRLPTEAEWEYAARAGTTTPWFFGSDPTMLDEYAWYTENSDDVYHHVRQKKPSPWGLYDIYGNVGELVIDQYDSEAYKRLQGKTPLATETIVWPTRIFPQVYRGGSWDSGIADLRSAARFKNDDWRESDPNLPKSPWWFTDDESMAVGFRLLRPLDVPDRATQEKFWELYSEQLKKDVADRIRGGRGVYGLVSPKMAQEIKEAGE